MDAILNIIKRRPSGCTPLDLENIRHIISTNDINIQDSKGRTILLRCCSDIYNSKNIKVIKLLLKSGTDVNIQDNQKSTALIHCCKNRDIKIAKLLIENKANVNIQNRDRVTALLYASLYPCSNDIEIAKLLLRNGADVHIQDNYGNTAIMTTSQYVDDETCSLKMSRLLLEYDAKPYDTHDINIFVGNIAKLNALS